MNKYNAIINIKVEARDDVEGNEKISSMLSYLQLLLGSTNENKDDSIKNQTGSLNFKIEVQ